MANLPQKDMVKLLRHAVDLGCTFFDTAAVIYEATKNCWQLFLPFVIRLCWQIKFGSIAGQRIEDGKMVNPLTVLLRVHPRSG